VFAAGPIANDYRLRRIEATRLNSRRYGSDAESVRVAASIAKTRIAQMAQK
jgi:hypothetical protein